MGGFAQGHSPRAELASDPGTLCATGVAHPRAGASREQDWRAPGGETQIRGEELLGPGVPRGWPLTWQPLGSRGHTLCHRKGPRGCDPTVTLPGEQRVSDPAAPPQNPSSGSESSGGQQEAEDSGSGPGVQSRWLPAIRRSEGPWALQREVLRQPRSPLCVWPCDLGVCGSP